MDAILQKGHRYTAGMAAKLQHVQGYRDTEVKEGNCCICVVAVEETRMLNLIMKDAERKLEFHLYFHFQEKHTELKLFSTGWKQNFSSLNWNQITSQ